MIDKKTLLYLEESRKKMTPIQKLIDDLYWEYDRMVNLKFTLTICIGNMIGCLAVGKPH